jgi:hypothetical protein
MADTVRDRMTGKIIIRPVGVDERAAWEPLWDGYIAFYKATLEPGNGFTIRTSRCFCSAPMLTGS